MAIASDRIQSLVIFNEIRPEYKLSDDIECRFYVDPSLDTDSDKIGLFRVGWNRKQDFIVIKDVQKCSADEFDERLLVFPSNELPKDMIKEDVDYQFCYFHPFGDRKKYQLCGRSESFKFLKTISLSIEEKRKASPSAPEMSIHYPILDIQSLDINQTNPKKVYDSTEGLFDNLIQSDDNYYRNSTPIANRQSVNYELEAKERQLSELKERFAQQNRIKELEIERLKTSVRLAEEKITSLEYELQTKVENEDRLELIQNDLMDTIRITETKICSLEEQIQIRDNEFKLLNQELSLKEKALDELSHKLVISQSELDLYQTRNLESIELEDKANNELKQENTQLKDKLEELFEMTEKLKENNNRLIKEKRLLDKINIKTKSEIEILRQTCAQIKRRAEMAEQNSSDALIKLRAKEEIIKKYAKIIGETAGNANQSVDELLAESRRALNSSITIYSNEMTEELKDFCIKRTKEALKEYSDIKSMADSIVYAMDEQFGNCWNCFVGHDFHHNSLLHVFGTYFSFAINDLKIIIYKTNDMADPFQVIRWAKESLEVDTVFKTEFTDHEFEDSVVSTVMETITEDIVDYAELSAYMTRELNSKYGSKYGFNWMAICGEVDRFESNLLVFDKKYKFIELEINLLKIIVIQFDEKNVENTNNLFKLKKFSD